MTRRHPFVLSLICLFVMPAALAEHEHLRIDGENLIVSGPFDLIIPRPPGANFSNIQNSHTNFGMEKLQTSRGGFYLDDRIMIIEVETTDAPAGTISYEGMPTVEFAGLMLPSRAACFPVSEEQVDADDEPLLEFMQQIGFDPRPGMYGRQLLLANKDGTGEGVALYAKRIESCENITNEQIAAFDAQFEQFVQRVKDVNPQADTERFED